MLILFRKFQYGKRKETSLGSKTKRKIRAESYDGKVLCDGTLEQMIKMAGYTKPATDKKDEASK